MNPKVSVIVPAYNVEKYIERMLKAIRNQTMEDFEVIIVNDGSTDGTQEKIEKFSKTDSRFISYIKENGGVSSARNFGLEMARGKYVVFWDADDKVPSNSLKSLCEKADETNADMVIGRVVINKTNEKTTPKSITNLSKQSEINKMDWQLIWLFTASNRLFKKEIIDKYDLKFTDSDLGEDGIFWLNYLSYCSKVAGVDANVYEYEKRFFLDQNPSLTQKGNRYFDEYYDKFIAAIENAADKIFASVRYSDKQVEYNREKFYQEIYKRILRNNIIADMYRNIWILTNKEIELMHDAFKKCKDKIYDVEWTRLLEAESDLNLSEIFLSKEEILSNLKITFVLTRNIKEDRLDSVIKSLYLQKYPYFELLIDEAIYENIDKMWKNKENCKIINGNSISDIKNNAVKLAKGEYIMFFDKAIIPGEKTIQTLMKKISKKQNITSLYYNKLKENHVSAIEEAKIAFDIKDDSLLIDIDSFYSNKVFRVDYLKKNIHFSNDEKKDMKDLILSHEILYRKGIKMIAIEDMDYKLSLMSKIKLKLLDLK